MKLPLAPGGHKVYVYDIEVFSNYFLAIFTDGEEWFEFTHEQFPALASFVMDESIVLAGYNNFSYDDIIIKRICDNPACSIADVKELSDVLIDGRSKFKNVIFGWQWEDPPWAYSIDLFMLLNKKMSLKELQCKSGFDLVDEYQHDFSKSVEIEHIPRINQYCKNDVVSTMTNLASNWDNVTLRETLLRDFGLMKKIWCMTKQAVAQHTFMTLHKARTGETSAAIKKACSSHADNNTSEWPMRSLVSNKVSYVSQQFCDFFARFISGRAIATNDRLTAWRTDYVCDSSETLANRRFSIGVGGIHSIDTPGCFRSTPNARIVDLDVASYYPSLIIEERLYPAHLGPGFVDDMRTLTNRRLAAKRSGDKKTAEALKIVINATFGKLNDAYSPLRSIPNAMRVTINGQLFILMLVEALYLAGFEILSANTDGVTVIASEELIANKLSSIILQWETTTHMKLERVDYTGVYRRDVNSYMATYVDDRGKQKIKYKGAINKDSGKADGRIIKYAAEKYITDDIEPSATIKASRDIRDFLFYLCSKNGGIIHYGEDRIGKSVRWYVCQPGDGRSIVRHNPATKRRKPSVSTLPHGSCAKLALDLRSLPEFDACGIDFGYYESKAWELIQAITGTGKLQSLPLPTETQNVDTLEIDSQ